MKMSSCVKGGPWEKFPHIWMHLLDLLFGILYHHAALRSPEDGRSTFRTRTTHMDWALCVQPRVMFGVGARDLIFLFYAHRYCFQGNNPFYQRSAIPLNRIKIGRMHRQ